MDAAREKQVFLKGLKGEPIGLDSLGTPLFVGDILIYATTQDTRATLKFGKITKFLEKDTTYYNHETKQHVRKEFVKVQVRTVVKECDIWVVGGLGIPNTRQALLMKDSPQEILDVLEKFENQGDNR